MIDQFNHIEQKNQSINTKTFRLKCTKIKNQTNTPRSNIYSRVTNSPTNYSKTPKTIPELNNRTSRHSLLIPALFFICKRQIIGWVRNRSAIINASCVLYTFVPHTPREIIVIEAAKAIPGMLKAMLQLPQLNYPSKI